jgi:hypothetical protein
VHAEKIASSRENKMIMRQIEVSVDVFARIWALRQPGEDSEDAILARLLDGDVVSSSREPVAHTQLPSGGFYDMRHDVHFAEGFEIFRTYKGVFIKATAVGGTWTLEDGRTFPSLNELSRSVVSGSENAWVNWNYRDDRGSIQKIANLRPDERVAKRSSHLNSRVHDDSSAGHDEGSWPATWRHDVVSALQNLGGKASLHKIYKEVVSIRTAKNGSVPPSFEAIIRRELENNSSDSECFLGRHDLFYSVDGLGGGMWGLR